MLYDTQWHHVTCHVTHATNYVEHVIHYVTLPHSVWNVSHTMTHTTSTMWHNIHTMWHMPHSVDMCHTQCDTCHTQDMTHYTLCDTCHSTHSTYLVTSTHILLAVTQRELINHVQRWLTTTAILKCFFSTSFTWLSSESFPFLFARQCDMFYIIMKMHFGNVT